MVEYRYKDKEYLLLIEMLALKAIGALDKKLEDRAVAFSPLLKKKTGMVDASWETMLMRLMEVDESYLNEIRLLWQKTQANHLEANKVADPREFARQFVWTNYL